MTPLRKKRIASDPHNVEQAKAYAARLLSMRDYARSELEAKLTEREYTSEVIQKVIALLKEYGYIYETGRNKDTLATMAGAYLAKKKNPTSAWAYNSLEKYLSKKGFDHDCVREYIITRAEADREAERNS
jgi:SOS response regulatory protein OraA/RecX